MTTDYVLVTRNSPPCSQCKVAKSILTNAGIEYKEVDIDDYEGLAILRSLPGIFYKGELLSLDQLRSKVYGNI